MPGILLDENLPDRIAEVLRRQGIEVVHVGSVGLAATADKLIWTEALARDQVILTKDSDYLDLAATTNKGRVILLATGNMRMRQLCEYVESRGAVISEFLNGSERVLLLRRD